MDINLNIFSQVFILYKDFSLKKINNQYFIDNEGIFLEKKDSTTFDENETKEVFQFFNVHKNIQNFINNYRKDIMKFNLQDQNKDLLFMFCKTIQGDVKIYFSKFEYIKKFSCIENNKLKFFMFKQFCKKIGIFNDFELPDMLEHLGEIFFSFTFDKNGEIKNTKTYFDCTKEFMQYHQNESFFPTNLFEATAYLATYDKIKGTKINYFYYNFKDKVSNDRKKVFLKDNKLWLPEFDVIPDYRLATIRKNEDHFDLYFRKG